MPRHSAPALTVVLFALQMSCAGPPRQPEGTVQSYGTLRAALRDGETQGRVLVGDVLGEHVYGVGAAEQLTGEITIYDGGVWVSTPIEGEVVTRRAADVEATVLFAARVDRWLEVEVAEPVDPSDFARYIAAAAERLKIDTSAPMPFVVTGPLRQLKLHVIAGACPIRAAMMGVEPDPPPFEMFLDGSPGTLVGIYAEDSGGVITHHGTTCHTHAIIENEGRELTGHIESVGLDTGAVLRLPDRR